MKKILIVVLFLIWIGLSAYTYLTITGSLKNKSLDTSKVETPVEKYISHIGCSDIREVIEDNGKYYIACYGGVLIIDKISGQILNQITMAKGLTDFVTTSLVKKGNTLYIGTQDGITIWDLYTNSGKKLSVTEGLPNGANILLKEDGKYIWIGTFDGLARLNTEDNQLEVFSKELTSNESEKLNVTGIAVTNDYAYFSIVANAKSSGFIAKFSKTTSEWEKFDAASLGDITQYARVDAMGLCSINDGVFFTEDKTLWKISDNKEIKPLKVFTAAHNDFIDFNILCSGNLLMFKTQQNSLIYDGTKVRPTEQYADEKILKEFEMRKNKTDFKKVFGENAAGNFLQYLGVIDDNVYLATHTGFWVYNVGTNQLTKISMPDKLMFESLSNFIFWPIEGSTKYILAEQSCGMGCEKPRFYQCTYPNNQCITLNFSEEVMDIVGPPETAIGENFGYYGLSNYEKNKDGLKFRVSAIGKSYDITLTASNLQWVVEKLKAFQDVNVTNSCTNDNSYKLINGTLTLDKTYCTANSEGILANGYYYNFNQSDGALRINESTKIRETLSPKMTEPKYIPFEDPDWQKPQLNRLVYVNGKIYYCTSRGLWVLDPSKNALDPNSWELFSIENGLLSNEVQYFADFENKLFVLTPAGITVTAKK